MHIISFDPHNVPGVKFYCVRFMVMDGGLGVHRG